MSSGIVCPNCGSVDSNVLDSRAHPGGRYRRRKCKRCGCRFTTNEAVIRAPSCSAPLPGPGSVGIDLEHNVLDL